MEPSSACLAHNTYEYVYIYFFFISVSCPHLVLNNVIANTTSREEGTVVSLECVKGYVMKRGSPVLKCVRSGQELYWSDLQPICRGNKLFPRY